MNNQNLWIGLAFFLSNLSRGVGICRGFGGSKLRPLKQDRTEFGIGRCSKATRRTREKGDCIKSQNLQLYTTTYVHFPSFDENLIPSLEGVT